MPSLTRLRTESSDFCEFVKLISEDCKLGKAKSQYDEVEDAAIRQRGYVAHNISIFKNGVMNFNDVIIFVSLQKFYYEGSNKNRNWIKSRPKSGEY